MTLRDPRLPGRGEDDYVYASARSAADITPNDSGAIDYQALYVGTSGNLRVDMINGETVTFSNLAVGFHAIHVSRVYSTGTSAANIVGLNW